MVRIRIGNDIPIRWAVTRCGVPEDFAGKSLKLYMRTAYSETEVTDFAVNGNVISWTFPGAQQKATGSTLATGSCTPSSPRCAGTTGCSERRPLCGAGTPRGSRTC